MEIKNDIINGYPRKMIIIMTFVFHITRKKTYTCVNVAVFYYDNSDYIVLPAGQFLIIIKYMRAFL